MTLVSIGPETGSYLSPVRTSPRSRPSAVQIVPLNIDHLEAVIRLHRMALPRSFACYLGERFLRLFYRTVVDSPRAFGFVALGPEQEVVGFVSATPALSAFKREFLRRNLLVLPFLILPKVLSWNSIKSVFQNMSPFSRGQKTNLPEAEIISISVLPSVQGRGIGRQLMDKACRELIHCGVDRVKVMVGDTLPANRFYQRMKFEWAARLQFNSRKGNANVYVKTLIPSPAAISPMILHSEKFIPRRLAS